MNDKEPQLLEKILDLSPSLIYICDISQKSHKAVYINKRAKDLVGCDKSDQEAYACFTEAIHPDDCAALMNNHEKLGIAEQGAIIESEFRLHVANDGWRWFGSTENLFLRDAAGGVKQILGIAEDITTLKMTTDLLHKSEQMFKSVFERSPIGIAVLNTNMEFVRINESFCNMLKYEETELLFKKFSEITAPENIEVDISNVKRLLLGEIDTYKTEKKYISKDGSLVPAKVTVRVIRDNSGQPVYLLPLVESMAEKILAEEELKEHREMLEEAEIIANLGSYTLDVTSGVWKSSRALDEIFGIDEYYKRTVEGWSNIIHPEDKKMMTEYFEKEVIENGKPFDKEYRIVRISDKAERWVHGLGALKFGPDGRPTKMYGTIQDITGHKIKERASEHQMETLERLNKMLMGREVKMAELKERINKLKRIER